MFIDDYTPMKRIGIEELEGCLRILQDRFDEQAEEYPDEKAWMDTGAWLALHLMMVGRFRHPEDFMNVFDMKCSELYGCGDHARR